MMKVTNVVAVGCAALVAAGIAAAQTQGSGTMNTRPRARDLRIRIGVNEPGPLDAITDVAAWKWGRRRLFRETMCAPA